LNYPFSPGWTPIMGWKAFCNSTLGHSNLRH